MRVCVVFTIEEVFLYLVTDPSAEDLENIKSAHGMYDEEISYWLNSYLPEHGTKINGPVENVDLVVLSGVYL